MAARSGCSKVFATDLAGYSREDSLARGEAPTRLLPTVNIENPFRAIPLSLSLSSRNIYGGGTGTYVTGQTRREREMREGTGGRKRKIIFSFCILRCIFFSSGIHGDKPPEGRGKESSKRPIFSST